MCPVYITASGPSYSFTHQTTGKDVFPPRTTRTKKARRPVAFLHVTHQKNHKLLDSRVFFWGNILLQRAFFFFFNVLSDLQKAAALTGYYALDYFLSFFHHEKKFKLFDFPDIFP